jgi:RimJ/RimL family protein N-acetyltransferase
MEHEDGPALLRFFKSLPREDRFYLRDNVTDENLIEKWVRDLDYDRIIPILALKGEDVVGDATLHRSPHYWTRHVGEIRIVTAPGIRRKGLGILLAREIFRLAIELKMDKIVFMLAENQKSAMNITLKLGFRQEAVLKGQIMDPQGLRQDMIIMSQDVQTFFEKIQDQIMDSMKDYSGG